MLMNFACRALFGGTKYTANRKLGRLRQAVHVPTASISNASADICLAEVGNAEVASSQPGAQLEWTAASCPRQQSNPLLVLGHAQASSSQRWDGGASTA